MKAELWGNAHPAQVAQATYVAQYRLPLAFGLSILKEEGPTAFYDLPGPFLGPQQNLADLYAQAGEIPAKEDVTAEFTPQFNAVIDKAVKAAGKAS